MALSGHLHKNREALYAAMASYGGSEISRKSCVERIASA